MRFWWVNQKQTYRHEVPGGYLWSPKRKRNGSRNPYYDFMREVAPGDVVFSYAGAAIKAMGVARSHAYESPKPMEFGQAGAHWETIGWRVDVRFHELEIPLRTAEHAADIAPLLPERYAPLRADGFGLQNLYLTHLPTPLASRLVDLIGREARNLVEGLRIEDAPPDDASPGLFQWEAHLLRDIEADDSLASTEKLSLVLARRGQGRFKEAVLLREKRCRITGVDRLEHLRASHCKPWRDSTNSERLDGANGLLLTPNADHLFDRGFISFERNGRVIVSPVAHGSSLQRLGLDTSKQLNVGPFSYEQESYLEYHRENVLLLSRYLHD